MNDWLIWSLVLFAAGLMIAVMEVVLPSAGILSIAAIACLGGSLWCSYQVSGFAVAVMGISEAIVVPTTVFATFKILPKTAMGRQLFLSAPTQSGLQKRAVGPTPASPAVSAGGTPVGCEGRVVTMLRPSGTAELNGRRVSVVSNGNMIPVDARIRVIHVEGTRIVVEEIQAAERPA